MEDSVVMGLFLLALFLAGFVGWWLIFRWQRRQRAGDALEPSCLLCDSHAVDVAPNGVETCRQCGYSSSWLEAPELRTELNVFQDLKNAGQLMAEAKSRYALRNSDRQAGDAGPLPEPYAAPLIDAVRLAQSALAMEPRLKFLPDIPPDPPVGWLDTEEARVLREFDAYVELLRETRSAVARKIWERAQQGR